MTYNVITGYVKSFYETVRYKASGIASKTKEGIEGLLTPQMPQLSYAMATAGDYRWVRPSEQRNADEKLGNKGRLAPQKKKTDPKRPPTKRGQDGNWR